MSIARLARPSARARVGVQQQAYLSGQSERAERLVHEGCADPEVAALDGGILRVARHEHDAQVRALPRKLVGELTTTDARASGS
jgi:hypothetical protein